MDLTNTYKKHKEINQKLKVELIQPYQHIQMTEQ